MAALSDGLSPTRSWTSRCSERFDEGSDGGADGRVVADGSVARSPETAGVLVDSGRLLGRHCSSACNNAALAEPFCGRLFSLWKARIAARVLPPVSPSAGPASYPSALSRSWTALTVGSGVGSNGTNVRSCEGAAFARTNLARPSASKAPRKRSTSDLALSSAPLRYRNCPQRPL